MRQKEWKYVSELKFNKTQYDWFPGKSQNPKKSSAKFKSLKIIGRFLTFCGIKIPPDGHNKFWGSKQHQKLIHSTVEILSMQIFSKIWQLLKNHYLRWVLNIWGVNMPPRGSQQLFGVKITSKMNSQHRRITQCANFQQNLTTFKNHYLRGFLDIWGVKMGREFWSFLTAQCIFGPEK